MEGSMMMDNDSGYVSNNQECNSDYSFENLGKTRPRYSHPDYLSEDALLEKPFLGNQNELDSVDVIINSSLDSVRTSFSGLEDSDPSETSFVIPEGKQINWEWKEILDNYLEVNATVLDKTVFADSSRSIDGLFQHKILSNVTNTYHNSVLNPTIEDKENIPPSFTPKKRYENNLTSDVSPDLFDEDERPQNIVMSIKFKSPVKKETPKDIKLLKKVQSALCGVHPPPNITTIQLTATQMLDKIEENKHLFWKSGSRVSGVGKSLLVGDEPECVQMKWPVILKSRFHGLHYNKSKISEDIEYLCGKYCERYVSAETQSSCTVFESNSSSSQKRKFSKPKWGAKSPGRRLSHLARRRITFSSSSLQASSSSAILGSRARQILVDARKMNMLKKSPKKSPRKTPSKSPFKIKKITPSSSAKKKLVMKFRQMSGEFDSLRSGSSQSSDSSFKSALFYDPTTSKDSDNGSMERKSTKRALFPSPKKYSPQKKSPLDKKRKRNDHDESNPAKFARSMSLDQAIKSDPKLVMSRALTDTNMRQRHEELTDQHKKKLQWAVYESLRLQNITSSHPQFKVFASVLARVTRKFLPSLRFEGRTTDKMFRIARYHSYAVVKGKTVDEIVNEYMRNKIKNQKPQGYVGLEQFNIVNNEMSGDKENVLQDRVNIIESIEKRREHAGSKAKLLNQSRIDRIKKVISFEEKESS